MVETRSVLDFYNVSLLRLGRKSIELLDVAHSIEVRKYQD